MSVNYATGLSEYANKGICGLPELFDAPDDLEQKVTELCKLIQLSKHTVVHTGAGISTSSGIPDFRGPKGVWTLEKLGQQPSTNVSFQSALPSVAHQLLVEFERKNLIHYLITQNIDGLHFRSGFPRDRLSILHGDMFLEACNTCGTLFVRNIPSTTMGLRRTGVACAFLKPNNRKCRGKLCDSILDWENDLPYLDYNRAIEQSKRADLHICIGTSLQMYPAASLPLLRERGIKQSSDCSPSLVIINLQPTKMDKHADIVIHAPADTTMCSVARLLGISTPPVHKPETSLFKPTLVLKSLHSDPLEPLPWQVLPHPIDGTGLEINRLPPPNKIKREFEKSGDFESHKEEENVSSCSDLFPATECKRFKADDLYPI